MSQNKKSVEENTSGGRKHLWWSKTPLVVENTSGTGNVCFSGLE